MHAEGVTREGAADGSTPRQVALAACVHALVAGVLLFESLVGGKVLSQADALYAFPPWSAVAPEGFEPSNELLLDQSIVFLPWTDFAAERVRAGELPLWNPYSYCGQPLVAAMQSAVYFPLSWVHYAVPSLSTWAWTAAAKLVLAGLFTFLFLRRLGLRPGTAILGGVGFELGGFMVAWLGHAHTSAALFLPALLWSVERTVARPRAREASLFGLLVGLQLVAGHVQTSLHVSLWVGLWALFRLRGSVGGRTLPGRGLLWLGAGAVAGGALAAPQLLPLAEYLALGQGPRVFDATDTAASFDAGEAAVLLVDPDRWGAPHTRDWVGPLGPNVNYNELIGGYVGRALLVLALAQVGLLFARRSPRRAAAGFLAAMTVVAALVAWQIEPLYAAFRGMPVLRTTKLTRMLLFVGFGLACLGAMGAEGLLERARLGARAARAACAVAVAVAALELYAFGRGYNPQVERELLLPPTEVTDFLRSDPSLFRVVGTDNTILMPNANVLYRIPMVSGYDAIEYARYTELALRLTTERPEFPFVASIRTFDRLEALPLASLLNAKYFLADFALPEPLEPVLDAELLVYENPFVMPRAFLARTVEVVADPDERLARLGSADFDPWVALIEEESEAARRVREASAAGGAARSVDVVRYEPRELELSVAAERPVLLVVADAWAPGWIAEIAGPGEGADWFEAPIERVDHALRGVFLDPGAWRVRMRYDPASTRVGLLLAGLAGAALAAGAVRG